MKSMFNFIAPFFLLMIFSCSDKSDYVNPDSTNKFLKDFRTWWNYNYKNIKLSEDYTALDASSHIISRESFLKSLCSGEYVAFRLKTTDSAVKYKLFKLNSLADGEIRDQVKQFGEDGLQKYKMEGTKIPDFNFSDLNGKVYNKETTKGKIVVLKCWFIHCQVCVEEMPALNEIVRQYQNRKDVLFLSLAFDSKEKLNKFLTKTKFDYAVIPVQEKYMEEKLKVTAFPTQFIINKNGLIVKVVNDYHDMISSLKRETLK